MKIKNKKKQNPRAILPKKSKNALSKKIASFSNFEKIAEQIKTKLAQKKYSAHKNQIISQRNKISKKINNTRHKKEVIPKHYVQTGIQGFDKLMDKGIPQGSSLIICGGPGSGKTIFCLQALQHAVSNGQKGLYMTFEESPARLKDHMHDFGWHPEDYEKKGKLIIKQFSPFEVTRQVEAMLEQAKGELMIDVKPLLFPKSFKPDWIFVDSLSAIASAFIGKEETYRIYIEQLFKLFEELGATSFLISESIDVATKLSTSGVEEFLADGVIALYSIKHGNVRENAVEIIKIRGAGFSKRIVAMKIKDGEGIIIYPEQEVFGEV